MSDKHFTCIICPRGCHITVSDNLEVSGNFCPRGKQYVLDEIKCPKRTITSIIKINNIPDTVVSIKTTNPIPKDKIFDLIDYLKTITVSSPTKIGKIIAHNPLGLDTNVVITKEIKLEK